MIGRTPSEVKVHLHPCSYNINLSFSRIGNPIYASALQRLGEHLARSKFALIQVPTTSIFPLDQSISRSIFAFRSVNLSLGQLLLFAWSFHQTSGADRDRQMWNMDH
jgi:hypothetical protein